MLFCSELNIEAPDTKSEPSEQYHSTEALKTSEPQTPNAQKPEPQTPEPEVQKPEVQKPEARKPEARKPEVQKPEERKPEARKPEVQKPEARKSEARKPEVQKPEARKSEARKPEARKPEVQKPEERKPEARKPEARKPEFPQMPETLRSQFAQTPEAKMPEERIPESLQKPGPKSKRYESPADTKPSPREAARSVPHVTHWYPSPLHVYDTDEPDQFVSQDEQQESRPPEYAQDNQKLPADGTSTVRDNTTHESVEEKKKASLPPIPRIVVTGEKKPKKRVVRRVSSVLKNDMEQYLEGYGEDYGALSSTTDLDLEGLHLYKPSEIKKSLTTKGEGSTQSKTSKEHRRKREKKKSRKKKEKPPKNNPHFGKTNVSEDVNTGDDGVHSVAMVKTIAEPGDLIATQLQSQRDMDTETSQQDSREQEDADSVAVNTSLGSSGSESSLANVGESKGVSLPLEEETINDQVRRLQVSVEIYSPESLGDGKVCCRHGDVL